MKNLTKKGFTLVELIVVITILAILGTIAFLNFGQYTDDAKDAKVTSDVKQIVQKIAAATAKDKHYTDIITPDAAFKVPNTSKVNSGALITSASGTSYDAGTINYTGLGIKKADFQFKDKDGTDQPYVFAYVVNKDFSTYEVAGNIFDKAGNPTVVLEGTYYQVDPAQDVKSLIETKDATPVVAEKGKPGKLY